MGRYRPLEEPIRFTIMFDDWTKMWRETVDNFDRELHGDDGDLASRGMRRQLTAARGALAKLQAEIDRAETEAASERDAEQVCLRRQAMAQGIDDEETARIAAEYAVRHAERADLYERKTSVLREEHALMLRDLTVMEDEFSARIDTSADAAVDPDDEAAKAEAEQRDLELARLRRERAANDKLEELKRRMRG